MRTPVKVNRTRSQTAVARTVEWPVGGWDTEDPLPVMDPEYAVILDNMIPRGAYGELRRGYVEQVSGTPAPVQTLAVYQGAASGYQLFAVAGTSIYDVTAKGSLGAAGYTGCLSPRFQWINFGNTGARFLVMCNGAQAPINYNGSAWADCVITTKPGDPINIDPTKLIAVMAHKGRLHFAEKGSLRVWFLDPSAIQGQAGLVDLAPVCTKGGELVALGRLTLDGGNGPDDYAVYVTSKGQVAIYQGTDPASSTAWALVGVYNLPEPVGGHNCLIEYGVDILVITTAGLIPLSMAMRQTEVDVQEVAYSKKIHTAWADAANLYGANFGWQALLYPGRGGLTIINVPTAELSQSMQFVRSNNGGAWCRFLGLPAFCWALAGGKAFFGSTAGVYLWDVSASDNGEFITADVLPAFQGFGSRVNEKVFVLVRALLQAPSIVRPALDVVTNYDKTTIPSDIQTVVAPGDLAPDDGTTVRQEWTGASGSGYVGAPRMRINLTATDDVDRLAIDANHIDLLVIASGSSDHLLTRPNLPLDVQVRCIGWDLLFKPGAVM